MINFKDRQDLLPSLITVSSVVVLAGTLAFMIYANRHPLSSGPGKVQAKKELLETQELISRTRARLQTSTASIDALTWSGQPQQIQTTVLSTLNSIARKQGVKINTVRPQRTSGVDELSTLPYLVTVEGTFPQVLSFERAVEDPLNKLAVNVIQITSVDASTNQVTASIGVVAYMNPRGQTLIETKEGNARA